MAQLNILGISGIRSYAPEPQSVIHFHSPLTLILGENGCGKTTIIECLKFITTGEVPPGCGKGASFVHDPKMTGDPTVRAQVKLRFRNKKGETMTSVRVVEATQKLKKLEFSSVDSTLSYTMADGSKRSISSKCLDFVNEMTAQFGVPKPILDNVIFCHQEDSNWPLDEGKRVKEKFDAIFNATKYIKCLDNIRKLRKDKKQYQNNMKETLGALKINKDRAVSLKNELNAAETELAELQVEKEQLINDQKPLRKRLLNIEEFLNNTTKIKDSLSSKEHSLRSLEEIQSELKLAQTEVIDCTDIELAEKIDDFAQENIEKQRQKKELEYSLKKFYSELEKIKRNEAHSLKALGRLQADQKINKENSKKRDENMRTMADNYDIKFLQSKEVFDGDDAADVVNRMHQLLVEKKSEISEKNSNFDRDLSKMNETIDDFKSKSVALEHDIASLTKRLQENYKKTLNIESTLRDHKQQLSSTDLDSLKSDVNNLEKKIEDEEINFTAQKYSENISKNKADCRKLDLESTQLNEKIGKMNKNAQLRSQLNIHLDDKKALEDKNKFLMNKNKDDLETISCHVSESELKIRLEEKVKKMKSEINEKKHTENELSRKKFELGMKVENKKKEIQKIEKEISEFDAEIEELCEGSDFESEVERCRKQVKELQNSHADNVSASATFQRFKSKILDGSNCPLCHVEFSNLKHKEDILEEIDQKTVDLPKKLQTITQKLKNSEKKLESLITLQPRKEKINNYANELDKLKIELRDVQKKREKVNDDLEGALCCLTDLGEHEEIFSRIHGDVLNIDSNFKNIKNLNSKISALQNSLGSCDTEESMDDLMLLQSTLEKDRKELRQKIEKYQDDLVKHSDRIQKLKSKKISISTQVVELQRKAQEVGKLQEDLKTYESEKTKFESEISTNREKLNPIKNELTNKIREKNALTHEKNTIIDDLNAEHETLKDDYKKTIHLNDLVTAYHASSKETDLADSENRCESIKNNREAKEKTIQETNEQLKTYENELQTQNERKRNLENERKIREKGIVAERYEQEIKELKKKIENMDLTTVDNEREDLIRQNNKIVMSKATLEGREHELTRKKKDLRVTLETKDIKFAVKNHREKDLQIRCIDTACNDINTYYRALETAVMKFHQEKMTIINKILKRLWICTYKGNDIDCIQIKTDETESQGADKRRVYNYRVIMVKNGVEMDMRGRCSAGQKVLASLLIRMALAETFSANCGILALDEPTTNLDQANINALCESLIDVVRSRGARNLQLIVISHDQAFVQRLAQADQIEYYYKITRDERGSSKIIRRAPDYEEQ